MAQRIDTGGDINVNNGVVAIPPTQKLGLASISAHKQFVFRINPYNINWGYNLRTHVDDTYGGKIVQILGTDLTSLTIDTVSGKGGIAYLQEFAKFWRDMCTWQQNTQELAIFSFPPKNYSLKVWAQSMTFNNKLDNLTYPINMTFQIQEDINGTLKKTSMTDTIKKLATGIGYTRNDYNYPSSSAQSEFQKQILKDTGVNATPTNLTAATGTDSSLDANQQANAQAIIGVALQIFPGPDGKQAAIIGVMAALAESEMKVINYGDVQNGSMTSSRGLFQQIAAWGPLADRLDPIKSSTFFFTGGQAGQRGLKQVPDWQGMTPWLAAQAVQGSEFSDGSNYHDRYDKATSIVAKIIGSSAAQTNGVSTTGVNITLPTNTYVEDAVQGKVIKCPNQAVANGITAGLFWLGTPYVYGGGDGMGSGPDHGSRAGNNNPLTGFDCSGLTGYIVKQMGFQVAGSNSDTQRSGGTPIPYADKLPGDIIGYPGHVAMFVGTFSGIDYILEAPDTGLDIRVIHTFHANPDANVHRYWL